MKKEFMKIFATTWYIIIIAMCVYNVQQAKINKLTLSNQALVRIMVQTELDAILGPMLYPTENP